MHYRSLMSTAALAAGLALATADAMAFDQSKYPDWSGAWRRTPTPGVTGQPGFDQTKRLGPAQEAPLTPEAEAIMRKSMADQAKGGQGNYPTYVCIPPGMPRTMNPYGPMEIVITPETTHMFIEHIHDSRRIFTDGRQWPKEIKPTLVGYAIGKWVDTDGDGRYDMLEIETRGMRGPRAFDATGMPLSSDNKTIVKEKIFLDKNNPNIMYNDITTFDSSLTRPWAIIKKYNRRANENYSWPEENCAEGNGHVEINGQGYFFSGDGNLMPSQKDQPPPDLRHFKQAGR